MKMTVFWDVEMFSLIDIGQCFGSPYCLHH
jgi:hypothetical protein